MDWDVALLFVHVLGAAVLIGTGSGIAFFMLMAHRTGDAAFVARTAAIVTFADWVFTATAMIAQPVSGTLLALSRGWSLDDAWLFWSVGLYALIAALWMPVVMIQYRLRRLAERAAGAGAPLPPEYHRAFRLWFALGIPAFAAILTLLWLMLHKPGL